MRPLRLFLLAAIALEFALAQRVGAPTDDLDRVPLDELFSVQVTSVGRKAQQFSKAPAAVFVLTAADIRRSGATSIPEALQWVPGLTVLRLDGRSWVVSARGNARLYADKILVMIDGRSLYTPLFSGVIWDAIDVPLEDIEQIEIVRGPGAVMWGPNAVNGVINIITKSAKASKGGVVSAATGNELRGAAEAHWSAVPSDRLSYRVWGKLEYRTPAYGSPGYYFLNDQGYQRPELRNLNAASGRTGFRFDVQPTDKDQWMVEGDLFSAGRHDSVAYPVLMPTVADPAEGHTHYDGGYLQARWTRTTSAGNESALQFSYDKTNIDYPFIRGDFNNLTVDFQKRRQTSDRNEIYWGAGYQQYWDHTFTNRFAGFDPPAATYRAGDVVLRDEWQMVPQRLSGSIGVRIDYNSYRQFEYQPSFRLLYTPNARQSAWVGLSRAVRVPSRLDRNLRFDDGQVMEQGFPVAVTGSGSETMRSETERSLEAGYRLQSGQHWSVDLSAFWSYYGRLRALQMPSMPEMVFRGQVPVFLLPMTSDNAGAGRSYGGEVWATWQVRPKWRLIPSYSFLNETTWLPSAGIISYGWDGRLANPRHQALLRSQHDLSRTVQVDLMAKARSRDPALNLPGAFLVDVRLGWRPTRSGELSLTLNDLTDRRVLESYSEGPTPAIPIRRTFVVKWTQRF